MAGESIRIEENDSYSYTKNALWKYSKFYTQFLFLETNIDLKRKKLFASCETTKYNFIEVENVYNINVMRRIKLFGDIDLSLQKNTKNRS